MPEIAGFAFIRCMNQYLAMMALVVRDYDEAIEYYTKVLGFKLIEDTPLTDLKRWVVVKPAGDGQASLLLARAASVQQEQSIGNQSGGRVFLFLYTDDFHRDYELYKSRGVEFVRPPVTEPYGTVAVFRDIYGNLWDLIEPV